MATDAQQCEDAGAALYDALRLFEGCSTGSDPNYRATFVDTYGVLAVHVAAVEGNTLTAEQVEVLSQVFYLDEANIPRWPVVAAPELIDSAVGRVSDWVAMASRIEMQQGRAGENPSLTAADYIFSVMLRVASMPDIARERYATLMNKLAGYDPLAATAATEQVPSAAAPAASPPDTATDSTALPEVACAARLHADETCHAVTTATLYQESNRVSRVRYRGVSADVRLARGLSYRSGSYGVDQTRTPRLEEIATGELSITNQRLIFLGEAKSLGLPFARFLSCDTEPGRIMVARANAGLILFDQLDANAVAVFEQVSGTPAAHRLEIEQQQEAAYQASRDEPEGATSHIWRNVVLVAILVAGLLFLRHLVLR